MRTKAAGWLTVSDAARFLGVSVPTLRRWTDEGRIAVFRTPGGHRRYREAKLVEFHRKSEERSLEEEALAAARDSLERLL